MIKFNNCRYVSEHGKQPRGLGHWAFLTYIQDFAFEREKCPLEHYKVGRLTLVWASDIMSLTDAKNEIKSWLLEHGYKNEIIYIAD